MKRSRCRKAHIWVGDCICEKCGKDYYEWATRQIRLLKDDLAKLQSEINGIYADAVKYPQLALPEKQLERLAWLVSK